MSSIALLRSQHTEIRAVFRELTKLARMGVKSNAAELCVGLTKLRDKLKEHLALEDKELYPVLLEHKNARVAGLARKFMEEAGQFAPRFLSYCATWMHDGSLEQEPARFQSETQEIFRALSQRIDNEDLELYPLLEKVGGVGTSATK